MVKQCGADSGHVRPLYRMKTGKHQSLNHKQCGSEQIDCTGSMVAIDHAKNTENRQHINTLKDYDDGVRATDIAQEES